MRNGVPRDETPVEMPVTHGRFPVAPKSTQRRETERTDKNTGLRIFWKYCSVSGTAGNEEITRGSCDLLISRFRIRTSRLDPLRHVGM